MNKKEKAQKKEKKKKLPLRRSASNITFALREVWHVSAAYFVIYYLVTLIYAPLDFLTDSFLLRMIVNKVEGNESITSIIVYIIVIASFAIAVDLLSGMYWRVISPGMYERISASIERKLFKKASSVELACYETPAFYDKYMKAMEGARDRIMRVMNTIDNLIWRTVTLLCNSFLLFFIDPVLIIFGLLPLLLGFVRRWQNRLNKKYYDEKKPIDRRVAYVRRTFYLNEYSKEMRIGGMYSRMLKELNHTYKDFKALMKRYGFRIAIANYIQRIGLEVVTILGAMFYAVWCTVYRGSMTIGDCIVILNSIGTISYCLNSLVQNFAEFGEHSLFLEDVRYFLDYEPKIKDEENAPVARYGDIELENVFFRYEGAEVDTLKGVSMKIKKGEHVALVGQNGSGKTTLVKLLLRLYDPTSGTVKMDGEDIKDYRLSTYRDSFNCVFQDFKVFSMSVKENVLLRRCDDSDDELVVSSLKESGAYDKIMSLDNGINSTLTREFDDNGANLSIGEQQKVSLARVFADSTPVVILDEPSSALDPIAEHKMFENMMRASKGSTVIFISHRLSSAVDADRIFLLENGEIAESGTHHELMQKKGKYEAMFTFQAQNYLGKEGEGNE
ncbi:MAG: ABC transporter ATP-binding protein [Clostridia bacterium]|nr:ABC transporter ATP-binding protein [Clostridia bacterium]